MKKNIIFLGSTYEDLKHHRLMIIHALTKLGQNIQAMEFWSPSESDSLELSLHKLRKSKIYIGVLGSRYGTVTKNGKSITHLEYQEAVKLGLKRQVYLIDEKKHPVSISNVDTGKNAKKLRKLKEKISKNSVRGTFTSADDLSSQIISNIINILREEGEQIKASFNEHGITNFPIKYALTSSLKNESFDISSMINMVEDGTFKFTDTYIESILAASVITKNIKEGNLNFITNIITFKPEVYKFASLLIKDYGANEIALEESIRKCKDILTLRLLIILAGEAGAIQCIEIICKQLFIPNIYKQEIEQQAILLTSFNNSIKEALLKLVTKDNLKILNKYLKIAKEQKRWQAKQTIGYVIENYNKTLERNS